jgi:hypothetical protein
LEGSSAGKPDNALCEVPFEFAQTKAVDVFMLWEQSQTTTDVSEAFSAVEKIWRSFFDEDSHPGNAKRLRVGKDSVKAARGFPLVTGLSAGRVGILRGAGNAICAPLAAEFIRAYCETERGLP